jgi:hypothetical protein
MRVLRRARATKRSSEGASSAGWPAPEAWAPLPAATTDSPSWAPPPTWWSQSPTPPEPAPDAAIDALLVNDRTIPAPSTLPSDEEPRIAVAPRSVEATTVDVVRVLEAVTGLCDRVVEYIEADRAERRLVVDALTRLAQGISTAPATPGTNGERLLGGSMPTGPGNSGNGGGTQVDLRENETRVEVRCRFGDRWVDGFEIFDVVTDEFGIRYRLRRRIDGVVLPELFLATDIRHVETFEELKTEPARRHWSPL